MQWRKGCHHESKVCSGVRLAGDFALLKLLSIPLISTIQSVLLLQIKHTLAHFFHLPSDMRFPGSLHFWHRILAPSRHFDTRQGKEAAVMTKIIASVTIILSQMPQSPNYCRLLLHNSCNCSIVHLLVQIKQGWWEVNCSFQKRVGLNSDTQWQNSTLCSFE